MKRFYAALAVVFASALVLFVAGAAFAQVSPTGTLVGTVTDPSGAIVPGATVAATGVATGTTVTTTSGADGRFVLATMTPGEYSVKVTKDGFKTGIFTGVKITVGLTYELKAKLEVGGASTTVTVESGVQEMHTATASVASTVVGPEITQLPFTSRDTINLAILDPGAQTVGNPRNTSFDGLSKGSINITEDGINVQDNLLKSNDGFFSIIANKVDDISEFNISTAANSASQTGEGAVQISMVSQQGTNQFHGGVWEYFRNDYMNSNYYFNNLSGQPRQVIRSNQFGFKVGGPILKNKLFFYGDMDNYRFPHSVTRQPVVPTTLTAQGVMAYTATAAPTGPLPSWISCSGVNCTADLLGMAAANGNASTPDSVSGALFSAMASAATAPGVKSQGNPAPYLSQISFLNSGVDNRVFPDVRFDYDVNQSNSIEFAYHYSHFTSNPDFLNGFDPTLPVAPFNTEVGGQISNRNLFVGAWRTTIGSNKSNEIRFGIQSAPVSFFPNLGLGIYPIAGTNLGNEHVRPLFANNNSSGLFSEPFLSFSTQGRNTALGQLTDNFGWTKGSHFLNFGMTATDLRFNDFFDSGSVADVTLGVDTQDPASNMFTNTGSTPNLPGMADSDVAAAEQIYADLVGRVTNYGASVNLNPSSRQFQTGAPQLDKVRMLEMGFYGSDSWQVRPGLTFNYGLRWEYQGIPHDALNEYFNAQGGFAGVYGVSGLNNLFKPGTMTGSVPSFVLNGSKQWYNKYYKSFGPTVGVAWQPGFENSFYRKIFGTAGKTVFRAGYSISFDRPGLENFEALAPGNGGFVGNQAMNADDQFVAGTVALGGLSFQSVAQTPTAFTTSFAIDPANNPGGINVYNPNLHAPYVQSWSAGIQRQIGASTVFEVRYVGNHGVGLWEQADLNETNIFENGFLTEFKNAQANLANNGGTSFADINAGDVPVPIMTAAFTGSTTGSQTNSLFSNGTLVRDVSRGLAGSFANTLAKNGLTFICNLAGTTAFPAGECAAANASSAPAVGAFPKNFFVTNPDATGGAFDIYNGAQSTYNALQVDVRRRMAGGLQFNGSYTFSKALTDQYASSSLSFFQFRTLRDPGLDKGPAPFDIRHSFKLESLYNLPFGPGHRWTTGNGFINRLIGGWGFNTIERWQSGRVQRLTGGLGGTFNGNDGGVNITGMSLSQIQGELGVIKTPCTGTAPCQAPGEVFYFPANLLSTPLAVGGGKANSAIFSACSTPGTFCDNPFIYGPGFFRADWSVVKDTRITEKTTFELRLNMLNAFNNANFFYGGSASQVARSTSIQSNSFGRITSAYQDTGSDDFGGRIVEIVGRINF